MSKPIFCENKMKSLFFGIIFALFFIGKTYSICLLCFNGVCCDGTNCNIDGYNFYLDQSLCAQTFVQAANTFTQRACLVAINSTYSYASWEVNADGGCNYSGSASLTCT